jgi:hypothetical protein
MHEGLFYFFYFIINQESTFRESVVHNGSRRTTRFQNFFVTFFRRGLYLEDVMRRALFVGLCLNTDS